MVTSCQPTGFSTSLFVMELRAYLVPGSAHWLQQVPSNITQFVMLHVEKREQMEMENRTRELLRRPNTSRNFLKCWCILTVEKTRSSPVMPHPKEWGRCCRIQCQMESSSQLASCQGSWRHLVAPTPNQTKSGWKSIRCSWWRMELLVDKHYWACTVRVMCCSPTGTHVHRARLFLGQVRTRNMVRRHASEAVQPGGREQYENRDHRTIWAICCTHSSHRSIGDFHSRGKH